MFTVLIGQIEYLDNSFIQSYRVGQFYETNEIIQLSEQKLIGKQRCEWSFNTIAPANFVLRHYDAIDHTSYYHSTFLGYKVTFFSNTVICVFIQNYKCNIAALTWSKQIRHFLSLPVCNIYFLLTKRNKNLLNAMLSQILS